jgi:excisionase family DNA binding protein
MVGLAAWGSELPRPRPKTPVQQLASDHQGQMQIIIERALGRCLVAPTPEGRALRMALMKLLLDSEPLSAGIGYHAAPRGPQDLLTTTEAAELLDVSRPYVAMLADIGKLGEVRRTEGGHRRLQASAVHAFFGELRLRGR